MASETCAIGIDLGGTKIDIARVNQSGIVERRVRLPTDVEGGPKAIENQILAVAREFKQEDPSVTGVGIGVAGQVDPVSGVVRFAPNLHWHEVPLQEHLSRALQLPVVIVNDVRAATWGEWHYGAGQGCQDLLCLFVGTGIGGGVVSGGRMLSGCSNTCGELGHMTVDLHGPLCTCGNRGCLEALAGGWAIAKQAKEAIIANPEAGQTLLEKTNHQLELITTKVIVQAAQTGHPLAHMLIEQAIGALIAGCVGLVNAFNPCRLILGGGLVEGIPELIQRLQVGIRERALQAATEHLEVVASQLYPDSGVMGAAGLAMHLFARKES